MKNFIKYLVIALLFSNNSYYKINDAAASSGPERCFIEECLCEVIPSKSYSPGNPRRMPRIISVFFSENSYTISSKQKLALEQFVETHKQYSRKASVIGYADGCGSQSHNSDLSRKRAESVRLIMAPYALTLKTIAVGEASETHSESAKRVDIIIHTGNKLTTALEKIPSDYYLIDASGSMWKSYGQWESVIAASLKPGSKVYLSITGGCKNGQLMKSVSPSGGTEIWWSYWNIIDKMKPGETLLIVSDFESRVPLSYRERGLFENKLRDSKVKVQSITP